MMPKLLASSSEFRSLMRMLPCGVLARRILHSSEVILSAEEANAMELQRVPAAPVHLSRPLMLLPVLGLRCSGPEVHLPRILLS